MLRGLDAAQLTDVAATLTGAMADLARGLLSTVQAADAAADAEEARATAERVAAEEARAAAEEARATAERDRQVAATVASTWADLFGQATSELSDQWRTVASGARQAAAAWRATSDQLGRASGALAGSQYSNLSDAGIRDAARERYETLAQTIADYVVKARAGTTSDNDRERALAAADELQQAGERWLETQRALSGDATAYDRALTAVQSGWNAARDIGLEIESAEEARARHAEEQIDWLSRMYGADVRQEALLAQIKDAMAKGPEGLSELLRLVRQVPGHTPYQVPSAVEGQWNSLSPTAQKGVLARIGYTGPTGVGQAIDWLTAQGPDAQARWELGVRDAATASRFQPSAEGQRIWNGLDTAIRSEVLARIGYTGETGAGQAIDWVTATGTGSMWEYYVRQAGAGLLSAGRTISASALPQFAAGGDHAGGLRVVGERGWEVEATGPARIWSHEQARDILSPKQVNVDVTPVVVAVEGVRAVVQDVGRAIGSLIDRVGTVEAAVGRLTGETMLLHTRLGKLAVR